MNSYLLRNSRMTRNKDLELQAKAHTSTGAEDGLSSLRRRIERRRNPRPYEPFPAKVRGEDADGESFEIDAVLDNLGPGGLYVRLGRNVSRGAKLFLTVRLSAAPGNTVFAPLVGFRGMVQRSEPEPMEGTAWRYCSRTSGSYDESYGGRLDDDGRLARVKGASDFLKTFLSPFTQSLNSSEYEARSFATPGKELN